MLWMMHVTKKPLTISLLPSTQVFYHLNEQPILNMKYLWWCVHMVQPKMFFMLKCVMIVQLFGWDLQSLWQSANQKRCHALLMAGRLSEAHKAYRYMMDMSDEVTKASCLDWSNGKRSVMSPAYNPHPRFSVFKQEFSALYDANGVSDLAMSGDAALAASAYDRAIELYSAVIDLDSATDAIFANRCKAKLESKLWEEALIDATKVRWYLLFCSLSFF